MTYDDAPQRFCWHESMSNNRQEIRPWSPEEEARLLALHDEGMTATELGERLGRSRQAVYGRLQRFRKQRGRTSRRSGHTFPQWIG
ncbi:winged helix-turn-helix transcriptional regulator [Bradyrhizobium sp. 171]|nr:winged helix-turn-helix transcriptional regulator [Bradyrhizobium sp. 176]MCK1557253.1 winged helix-turn-helix transcriptional regulator [Bradyrhizobium sp. 171]